MKTKIKILLLVFFSMIGHPAWAQDAKKATRSSEKVSTVDFKKNKLHSANYYFLGAENTAGQTFSLSRAQLSMGNTIQTAIVGIAPAKAFVNVSANDEASQKKRDNPIYNADVKDLTTLGRLPVVLLGTRNPSYTDASTAGANQTVVLVSDAFAGATVLTNKAKLNDANGAATNGIVGIQASSRHIFAAVEPNGGGFGGTNSGIGILMSSGGFLKTLNAQSGTTGNRAQNLSSAGTNIAIQSDTIAMHWDPVLRRLFVGLHVAWVSGTANAHSLLVGQISEGDKATLTLRPALPSNAMISGVDDYIIGFEHTVTKTSIVRNVKTMHTSTKKAYVIVNGNVYTPPALPSTTYKKVFAIPIVHKQYSDLELASAEQNNLGLVTSKNNVNQDAVITAAADATLKTEEAAKVGRGDAPGDVEDMFVFGDTVYVCCAHATDKRAQGIFSSTAIFGSNGLVRTWTEWRRVMGAVNRVKGGSIDHITGQFWYLTNNVSEWNSVKVTLWKQKDPNLFGAAATTLESQFKSSTGGVHQLFSFHEKTPSFDVDKFALMVATGYQKVALIKTGITDGTYFIPTTGASTTIKTDSTSVIKNIGPICSAAVSLSSAADEGWLFVGGYNGVAVLCQSDGKGWTALANLTPQLDSFAFKKLGSFKNVHKLVCDDNYLYILTPKKLYRLEMTEAQFNNAGSPTFAVIAQPKNISGNRNDSFLDFVISGDKLGLLATTAGLYRTANGKNISISPDARSSWTEVKTISGFRLGAVTHLHLKNVNRTFPSTDGNLYATCARMSVDLAAIARFDIADSSGGTAISDATVTPIKEAKENSTDPERDYYYAFGDMRSSFATSGTFGFHALPKHFGRSDLVRKINMVPFQNSIRFSDMVIPNTGIPGNSLNAGIPTMNDASGAWIVYGDWGLRINE
jgi:hypothetical protein